MRIITWNINSVRLRINSLKRMVKKFDPDILCLQETKCPKELFPYKDFENMGFLHTETYGMKGYNGVSISSKIPIIKFDRKIFCKKDDARHISAECIYKSKRIFIHNFYVPAGGDEPNPKLNPKFKHKLNFLDEATKWFLKKEGVNKDLLILVGDLNIAPNKTDVWSHKQLSNVVSHTPIEIEKLKDFMNSFNFVDVIRHLDGYENKLYSWWSYRAQDWKKSNRGRRLDHIWISQKLLPFLKSFSIEKSIRGWKRPSDHVPVIADFEID